MEIEQQEQNGAGPKTLGSDQNEYPFDVATIRGKPEDLDALNPDFRERLGLLPEDEEGLSDVFKAHLGLQGLDGVNEIAEISMAMDWERDETIASFKFAKFAREKFQGGMSPEFQKEALKEPLLEKKHEVDEIASLAVWLAIQRFMGDRASPKNSAQTREKIPVMTKIYRTLEAHAHRKTPLARQSSSTSNGSNEGDTKREMVPFKMRKRSSWKKMVSFMSEKSKKKQEPPPDIREQAVPDPDDFSTDPAVMQNKIPTHELDLVHFIVGHGILRRDLRNEIYCQMCKQISKNPNKESEERGWQLLGLCAGCFLPGDTFIRQLKCFVKEAPLEYKDTYAAYTRKIMRRTMVNGMRYHPPNWLEFQATRLRKYVMLPVTFADGRVETLETDSATTSGEVCGKLANKIGLKDQFGFSAYICIYDKVSSLGSGMDHVMDAISECEQVVRAKGNKEEEAPWRLYFRKELFSPWYDPAYDDISTTLVYKQIVRGVRSREYKIKDLAGGPKPDSKEADGMLISIAAKIYYIDHGSNIVPGVVQQSLQTVLPSNALKGDRTRDQWTQAILTSFDQQGFGKGATSTLKVKEELVHLAADRWYLLFSGLFEAFRIAGPRLPKNDVVVAINNKGLYVMHEPYKVCLGLEYYEIVEIFCSRTGKMRGQSFSLVSIKGDEYTFMSPNSQNIASLVQSFLEGLRRRSRYAVGLQDYGMQEEQSSFRFRQGDVLLLVEANPENMPKNSEWVFGENERTGERGHFPLDLTYVIPTMTKPPLEFLRQFELMSQSDTKTLPKRKGHVLLGKETVNKESAA